MSSSPPSFADHRNGILAATEGTFVDEPESHLEEQEEATRSRLTEGGHVSSVRPDAGYLLKGWRRVLRDVDGTVQWWYTSSDADDPSPNYQKNPPGAEDTRDPPDIYTDRALFKDDETTVQVVEFRANVETPPKWSPPVNTAQAARLLLEPSPRHKDAWRWVHCTGLHGETLKAVCQSVGWPERKFGGIFTWTRSSMEWADGVLLVSFQNQGSRYFFWHGGGKYPVFITCSTKDPKDSSVTRLFDFVDRGCSRPEIILRKDPSLMFYGIVRAVIQDLRFSVHEISDAMETAFQRGTSQPKQSNLAYFYHLQDRLFILSLDTTALKNAATNLTAAAERMAATEQQAQSNGDPLEVRLISERTLIMLKDQMGLINLLSQELPDISRRTEAIVNLAFNTLAFKTNNLLQILAVITIASLPLTVVTGILGIQWFDNNTVTGRQIAITLGIVGGVVIFGLISFVLWFIGLTSKEKDDGSQLASDSKKKQTAGMQQQTPEQRHQFARVEDLMRDNQLINRKRTDNPMMLRIREVNAPIPRSTSPDQPTFDPPRKRRTILSMSERDPLSSPRRRWGTTPPARSPEAIAEEGNIQTILAQQSPQTSPRASPELPQVANSPIEVSQSFSAALAEQR
ncbi:hypothetical protein FRC14_004325 [Serendipita sp. 396]|nr:hypothetical protein FRC14_004325 [Serendipita sp. 396]KAG8782777.1 hypothetical protein FRC15_006402 [Serendipita sp. 397]KAG8826744.1 hypothetical protein FRC19_007757 [Serendipita sp. 401]KAG8867828.1 hypothetical protein FRC20_004773 [Serendipita sp. 405]KAG9057249.1 hypothetical protein FS842_008056 [Serendipita sp. 407]